MQVFIGNLGLGRQLAIHLQSVHRAVNSGDHWSGNSNPGHRTINNYQSNRFKEKMINGK